MRIRRNWFLIWRLRLVALLRNESSIATRSPASSADRAAPPISKRFWYRARMDPGGWIHGEITDLEGGQILEEMAALRGSDSKVAESGFDDYAGAADLVPLYWNA